MVGMWDEIKSDAKHMVFVLIMIVVLMLFALLLRGCS